MQRRENILQFMRYACVGAMNTLLTLAVIVLCKSIFDINEYVSNAIGYVAGLINSFIWNRHWVFRSDGALSKQAILFLTGFGICYLVQLLFVWMVTQSWFGSLEFDLPWGLVISGYGIATLGGNVVYTICNFLYNRLLTFKAKA